jgi:hypothetical protein
MSPSLIKSGTASSDRQKPLAFWGRFALAIDFAGAAGVRFSSWRGALREFSDHHSQGAGSGSTDGRLPLADLRRDVALLMTSGRDWTDRMKRIAARAQDLDIFSQTFVLRESTGWQITAAGREFLTSVERPALASAQPVEAAPTSVDPLWIATPSAPLIGVNPRRQHLRRRGARAGRSSAVA